MTDISFLLPTRGRPELVHRFLESLAQTTERLDRVEVVLGVDDDDPISQQITHDRVPIRKTVQPRGMTMGSLNRACYEASRGRYLFLMNDDVVACTPGWDRLVLAEFARYGDDIALIHVNDDLFGEKLCTFPLLSRRACSEIGLCPVEYKRYKIDDHIHETYVLLAALGHRRITYAANILFKHENFRVAPTAEKGMAFFAKGGKAYAPNPDALAGDETVYEALIEVRKSDARRLADLIECDRYERRKQTYAAMLSEVHDPYTYRRNLQVNQHDLSEGDRGAQLTVALISKDLRGRSARRCMKALKFDRPAPRLIIFDGNSRGSFNSGAEAATAMEACEGNVLVLARDDVLAPPGWQTGLSACLDARTAIVAPVYVDRRGGVLSAGVRRVGVAGDAWQDSTDMPAARRTCHAVRGGLLLIDRRKLPANAIDPAYRGHFQELDLCLRAWELGYKVVCAPDVLATRNTGVIATTPESRLLYQEENDYFMKTWVDSGRLAKIEAQIWAQDPTLSVPSDHSDGDDAKGPGDKADGSRGVNSTPSDSTMATIPRQAFAIDRTLQRALGRLMQHISSSPRALRLAMAVSRRRRAALAWHEGLTPLARQSLQPLVTWMERAYERASMARSERRFESYKGFGLVAFDGIFCGIPNDIDGTIPAREAVLLPSTIVATTLVGLRARIDRLPHRSPPAAK